MHEPGGAPEVVILEGLSSLNDSAMYWQKGKGALGSPRDSVVFPQVQAQTQPEFPAALEEIGFSEIRLVLMQFQIQTLMLLFLAFPFPLVKALSTLATLRREQAAELAPSWPCSLPTGSPGTPWSFSRPLLWNLGWPHTAAKAFKAVGKAHFHQNGPIPDGVHFHPASSSEVILIPAQDEDKCPKLSLSECSQDGSTVFHQSGLGYSEAAVWKSCVTSERPRVVAQLPASQPLGDQCPAGKVASTF